MKSQFSNKELGIIQAVLERFEKQRLPELLKMKEKVDVGETLSDHDIAHLKTAMDETSGSTTFAEKHPEFRELVIRVTNLYQQITEKALGNEKSS